MKDLVLFAAALDAMILIAAVLGKLDDSSAWTSLTDRAVGQPWLGRVVRPVVLACEATAAAVLIVKAPLGLFLAGGLYFLFGAVLSVRYRALRNQTCACFGAMFSSRIGLGLICRNAVLSLGSLALAIRAPQSTGATPGLALCSAALLLISIAIGLRIKADSQTYASLYGTSLFAPREGLH
jgi:hypothetical protein